MSEHNITPADLEGLGLEDFDPAEYITNDEAAAVYINEALATNDAGLLASAIGDVARARGMTEIAKSAGITREALYKALRENSQPRMETIARVLAAMKLRFVVVPLMPDEGILEVKTVLKTSPGPGKARVVGRRRTPPPPETVVMPSGAMYKVAPRGQAPAKAAPARKAAPAKAAPPKAPAKKIAGSAKKAAVKRAPAHASA